MVISEGRGRPNHEDAEDAPALVKDGKIVPKEADPYAAPGMVTNSITFSFDFLDPKIERLLVVLYVFLMLALLL